MARKKSIGMLGALLAIVAHFNVNAMDCRYGRYTVQPWYITAPANEKVFRRLHDQLNASESVHLFVGYSGGSPWELGILAEDNPGVFTLNADTCNVDKYNHLCIDFLKPCLLHGAQGATTREIRGGIGPWDNSGLRYAINSWERENGIVRRKGRVRDYDKISIPVGYCQPMLDGVPMLDGIPDNSLNGIFFARNTLMYMGWDTLKAFADLLAPNGIMVVQYEMHSFMAPNEVSRFLGKRFDVEVYFLSEVNDRVLSKCCEEANLPIKRSTLFDYCAGKSAYAGIEREVFELAYAVAGKTHTTSSPKGFIAVMEIRKKDTQ